jgi:agmatinase/guanidinopropionase
MLSYEKRFIAVGGDHSTTLPLLREAKKKHGVLSLIHFDAHLDTYPAAWGCEYHHGTFARHAVEEGLIDPKRSLQIGVRGPLAGEGDLSFSKKHSLPAASVDDIRSDLAKFLAKLPTFDTLPTYISFDIDCLDPAYAPGTGTPVIGGLTTYETQRILRALKIKKLVAADVVEVSPPYDQSQITALAAVDVIFEFLGIMATKS